MDYSKFPFQRGAAGAGVGVRQARFLDTLGSPALKRKNRDGSVSRKVGDRLYVIPAPPPQDLDAYLSSGTMDEGVVRAVSSRDARGTFKVRGRIIPRNQLADYTGSDVRYHGNGKAITEYPVLQRDPQTGNSLAVDDFNGMPAYVSEVISVISQSGDSFEETRKTIVTQAFVKYVPYSIGHGRTTPTLVRYADKNQWIYGAVTCTICLGGQHRFLYVVDYGDARYLGNIETMEYQLPVGFYAVTISPLGRFAVGLYMRPEYFQAGVPHPINLDQCPGFEFHLSADGGLNWDRIDSAPILQEFWDTKRLLPLSSYSSGFFNDAVQMFDWTAAPLNAQQAVILMTVPYFEKSWGDNFNIKAKIKLGVIDLVAPAVVETVVLGDMDLADAAYGYLSSTTGVPIRGGVLFMVRPMGADDYRDNPPRCFFTLDGVNLQWQPPLPWPGWRVGFVTAISIDTIVVPVYDDERGYVLYESHDLGFSWKFRATLSASAPPPVKVKSRSHLLEFSSVTQLRDGQAPANATPGAPWVSDSRFAPPDV